MLLILKNKIFILKSLKSPFKIFLNQMTSYMFWKLSYKKINNFSKPLMEIKWTNENRFLFYYEISIFNCKILKWGL